MTPPVRSSEREYLRDVRFDRLTADKPLRVTPDESERLFSRTPSPSGSGHGGSPAPTSDG